MYECILFIYFVYVYRKHAGVDQGLSNGEPLDRIWLSAKIFVCLNVDQNKKGK